MKQKGTEKELMDWRFPIGIMLMVFFIAVGFAVYFGMMSKNFERVAETFVPSATPTSTSTPDPDIRTRQIAVPEPKVYGREDAKIVIGPPHPFHLAYYDPSKIGERYIAYAWWIAPEVSGSLDGNYSLHWSTEFEKPFECENTDFLITKTIAWDMYLFVTSQQPAYISLDEDCEPLFYVGRLIYP